MKQFYLCHYVTIAISLLYVTTPVSFASATGLVANFDGLREGSYGKSLTDGGITFSDLLSSPSSRTSETFSIEATSRDLGPLFSSPNLLTWGGFSPGTGSTISFGQFSSGRITFGRVANQASLDVYRSSADLIFRPDNILSLEARLDGAVVATDLAANTEYFDLGGGLLQRTFQIENTQFDELRLLSTGPTDAGTSFLGIDTVKVPEPITVLSSMLILSFVLFTRSRQH